MILRHFCTSGATVLREEMTESCGDDLLYVNCFGARFVHEPALPSSAWLRLLHFFVQILWCIPVSSEKPQSVLDPLPLGTAAEVLQPIIRVRSVHTDAMGVGFGI